MFADIFRSEIRNTQTIIGEFFQGYDHETFHVPDQDEGCKIKAELDISVGYPVLISVGDLQSRKGFEGLFRILSKLEEEYIYMVVGHTKLSKYFYWQRSKEMEDLYQLGKQLLGDKIVFTGFREDVSKYLKVSDVLLLNSENEGTPNSVFEAMACSCVPIIRKIPGLEENLLVHDEHSLIANDELELEGYLKDLLKYREKMKKMGIRAGRFVIQYNFPAIIELYRKQFSL